MRAEDIMSSPVVTVRPDTPVKAAIGLITSHGYTALPVVEDDDRLVGIVTEADLVRDRVIRDPRTLIWRDEAPTSPPPQTVGEVMTAPAIAVRRSADAAEVAKVLLDKRIRCAPVVDGAELVGIISRRDLLATLARDDLAIVADVRRVLAKYGGHGRWVVSVQDGVVVVVDEFDNHDDRHVAAVLAQSVPGVQAVTVRSRHDEKV
ncbi:HPP family protein [Umezawaea endophytica]|uniref:CBS domain-containing protein n=1 Tax=Umezawaea endophytica TaxID=1654476 RepID=A0A9X2VX01_9PSEU|nr:CBS domain-containing protein [Umezawaea endophytica]MCS7483682.1 CBS domain-containing protein [Umezawaea endophytica]